jgi:hypothetical protein
MPPAHQQQKRLLLLLKRGRWPYYAAIILLPIPRPGRHSHFSVSQALDDDGGLIARREFLQNFLGF